MRSYLIMALCVLCVGISDGQAQGSSERPNILVVYTDDQRLDESAFLPTVMQRIADAGVTFSRFYATTPVCCPSRVTLLRGQYSHSHGVITNRPDRSGSFSQWTANGLAAESMGPLLQSRGYFTSFIGKYINGYPKVGERLHIEAGWTDWFVGTTPAGRLFYDYAVNHNGADLRFGSAPEHYRGDVEGAHLVRVIREALDAEQPFFVLYAPFAPHAGLNVWIDGEEYAGPPIPAPRHVGALGTMPGPRYPSYDEEDVSDNPPISRVRPRLDAFQQSRIDGFFRARVESLLSVDEWLGVALDTLAARGELENTYVVFTSDNGFMLGEHRMRPEQKTYAYEESVRMPLFIRGPGISAGHRVDHLSASIDLFPTILDWAGVPQPSFVDGRSLAALARGGGGPWRDAVLTERWSPHTGMITFRSLLSQRWKLTRWYDTPFTELYDLTVDPYELVNLTSFTRPSFIDSLDAVLIDLASCHGTGCRAADVAPFLTSTILPPRPPEAPVSLTWLDPPAPNPARVSTSLMVGARSETQVHVTLVDMRGRTLIDAGTWSLSASEPRRVTLDVRLLAPGIYRIRAEFPGQVLTRSVAVL